MNKTKKLLLLPIMSCLAITLAACGGNNKTSDEPGSSDIVDPGTNPDKPGGSSEITEPKEDFTGAIEIAPYKKHKVNFKLGVNTYSFKLTQKDTLKIHFRSIEAYTCDVIETAKLFDEKGNILPTKYSNIDENYWTIFETMDQLDAGTYYIKLDIKSVADKNNATSTIEINSVKTVDLVMFMGQSNMAGRGVASEATPVIKGHGYEFKAMSDPSKLYNAAEPFGKNENNSQSGISETTKTGGMVTSIMEEYYSKTQIPMVGVSCSKGGTSIERWSPTGSFVKDAFARYDSAKDYLTKNNYKIRHNFAVWCQGETDGDAGMAMETYKEKFSGLVDAFTNKGLTSTYVVRIGRFNGDPASTDEAYKLIRYAQTQTCYDKDNAVLASTQFYRMKADGLMKDRFHYKQEAYNVVGKEAGDNIAYHINMEKQPSVYDYEYKKDYNPYGESILPELPKPEEVEPASDFTLTFDQAKEGTYDWSKVGEVKDGGLTITKPTQVKLANPIKITKGSKWTLQFKTKATDTLTNGTILTEGVNGSKAFINLPDAKTDSNSLKHNGFTIRDTGNTFNNLFIKDAAKASDINTFVMTCDGSTISAYQNGNPMTVSKVKGTANNLSVTFNYLFGGLGGYDYIGTIYHVQYNTKVLSANEFIK